MQHPQAVLDDKRERTIRHALKLRNGNSDDLIAAIDGCRDTPWNMGANDRHTVYDALALILRDNDHIEKFMAARKRQKRPAASPRVVPEPAPSCWPERPPAEVTSELHAKLEKIARKETNEKPVVRRQEAEILELSHEELAELEERKRVIAEQLARMTGAKP